MGRQPRASCQATEASGAIGSGLTTMVPSANSKAAPRANSTPGVWSARMPVCAPANSKAIPDRQSTSPARLAAAGFLPSTGQASKVAQTGIV